jgi:hypothetical protein
MEQWVCSYNEDTIPHDTLLSSALPLLFREVTSVLDFGGGPGKYLTGFRTSLGLRDLVTVEPHALGDCVFPGLQHHALDVVGADAETLGPYGGRYDLVQALDVLQHIPPEHHGHVLEWLAGATKQWLVFAAQPEEVKLRGEEEEEVVEEAAERRDSGAKTTEQWVEEIEAGGRVVFDAETTRILRGSVEGEVLREHLLVFAVKR